MAAPNPARPRGCRHQRGMTLFFLFSLFFGVFLGGGMETERLSYLCAAVIVPLCVADVPSRSLSAAATLSSGGNIGNT